jgi:hypothetical protein
MDGMDMGMAKSETARTFATHILTSWIDSWSKVLEKLLEVLVGRG